jgi:hypothetical protein
LVYEKLESSFWPCLRSPFFFTDFNWKDGDRVQTTTRQDLITAWLQLLDALQLLYCAKIEVDEAVKGTLEDLPQHQRSAMEATRDEVLYGADHGVEVLLAAVQKVAGAFQPAEE